MKKKLLAYVCMIACIFGLTACSGGKELTSSEQQRVDSAGQRASAIVSIFNEYLCKGYPFAVADMETNEEIEYLCSEYFGFESDGNAVATGVQSFESALEVMGNITAIGETSAVVKGKQIIVQVQVTGEKKSAVAEVIFSNDLFMRLKAVALNPVSTMGDLMVKAALNTVIGMGTVFAVLILIIFVISSFKLIAKFQESGAKKSEGKAQESTASAVQPVVVEEEIAEEEPDDLELVAVISAAIAASQGAVSADGFMVRSIIRRKIS